MLNRLNRFQPKFKLMLWTQPQQNVPDVREYKLVRFQRHTKKDKKGLQWALASDKELNHEHSTCFKEIIFFIALHLLGKNLWLFSVCTLLSLMYCLAFTTDLKPPLYFHRWTEIQAQKSPSWYRKEYRLSIRDC